MMDGSKILLVHTLFFIVLALFLSGCNSLQRDNSLSSRAAEKFEEISGPIDNVKSDTDIQVLNEEEVHTKDGVSYVVKTYLKPYHDNENNALIIQPEDNGPSFEIKIYINLYSNQVGYYDNEDEEFISGLHIENAENGEVIYDCIWVGPLAYRDDWRGISKREFDIELLDVDFDGYKDIRINGGSNGTGNMRYFYLVWDEANHVLIDDPYDLSSLGLPSFDEKTQLVHSMSKGSAIHHWYYTHQYINGTLTLVEEVSELGIWDSQFDELAKERIKAMEPLYDEENTTFFHFIKKQIDWDAMDMIVVEEKYMLINSDMVLLAEYHLNSDIALELKHILTD